MAYEKGDLGHFHNEFRDPHSGELVDPDSIVFKFETPTGSQTTLTNGVDAALTRSSQGRYLAIVNLNEAGEWRFRWETTGTYQGAKEFTRYVDASEFS